MKDRKHTSMPIGTFQATLVNSDEPEYAVNLMVYGSGLSMSLFATCEEAERLGKALVDHARQWNEDRIAELEKAVAGPASEVAGPGIENVLADGGE